MTRQPPSCTANKMAALNTLVFAFFAGTLLGGGFSVTDEEFQVSFMPY